MKSTHATSLPLRLLSHPSCAARITSSAVRSADSALATRAAARSCAERDAAFANSALRLASSTRRVASRACCLRGDQLVNESPTH